MDVPAMVAAVRRAVVDGDRDGQPVRTVVARRSYRAAIDDVWDALTNAERLPRWFLPVTGELTPGRRYQFEGNAGGEVLACDKPEHAAVTWEFGGKVSWLELRLTEGDEGTVLLLEHTAPIDPEFWEQYGPGAVGVGWDLSLMGLAQHLATGADNDPAAFAAWVATEEGRAFVGGCSAAWAEADIAAGREDSSARAAAERTTAFYTGG
jgi:uncharacterized protein YndB with AHSA1/START domain